MAGHDDDGRGGGLRECSCRRQHWRVKRRPCFRPNMGAHIAKEAETFETELGLAKVVFAIKKPCPLWSRGHELKAHTRGTHLENMLGPRSAPNAVLGDGLVRRRRALPECLLAVFVLEGLPRAHARNACRMPRSECPKRVARVCTPSVCAEGVPILRPDGRSIPKVHAPSARARSACRFRHAPSYLTPQTVKKAS